MTLRNLPSGLQDHLDNETTTMANCWKIVRNDGVAFRFTDADIPVHLGDGEYTPMDSGKASAIENMTDISASNLTVQQILGSDHITIDDLNAGLFDGAKVEIYWVNYKDPGQGTITLFVGYFGEVKMRDDIDFEVELKSLSTKLEQTIGRQYTQQCDANLGDSRCGVDITNYTESAQVDAVVTNKKIIFNGPTETEDYYKYGILEFTSGLNSGQKYEIKGYSGNFPIATVNINNNIFGILGNEIAEFGIGSIFEVVNSSGNNGTYTVSAIEYDDVFGYLEYDGEKYDVIEVGADSFTTLGLDLKNTLDQKAQDNDDFKVEGQDFQIVNSQEYDGNYQMRSVTDDDGNTKVNTERIGYPHYVGITKITTEENISSSTADGEVSYAKDGIFELWLSPPFKVQVNDTFEITAGCDKYFDTCRSKFDNVVNFRGFPHIPGRDSISQYPDSNK